MTSVARRLGFGVVAVALAGGAMTATAGVANAAIYWWDGAYGTYEACEQFRTSYDAILNPPDGDVVSGCVYFSAKPAGPGGNGNPGYYYRYYLTYV
jgi:hypothetical protein